MDETVINETVADAKPSPRARARAAGKAHLTIKAFSIETRQLALKHARLQGLSMASWIDRAVRTQAGLEGTSGPVVAPAAAQFDQDTIVQVSANTRGMSVVGELLAIAQVAQMIAEASGRPMSKRAAGRVYQVLDYHTRVQAALLPGTRREPPKRRLPVQVDGETKRAA